MMLQIPLRVSLNVETEKRWGQRNAMTTTQMTETGVWVTDLESKPAGCVQVGQLPLLTPALSAQLDLSKTTPRTQQLECLFVVMV